MNIDLITLALLIAEAGWVLMFFLTKNGKVAIEAGANEEIRITMHSIMLALPITAITLTAMAVMYAFPYADDIQSNVSKDGCMMVMMLTGLLGGLLAIFCWLMVLIGAVLTIAAYVKRPSVTEG